MSMPPGQSGYFSAPSPELDPNLFDGDHLKYDVRTRLWGELVAGLGHYLDLRGVEDWLAAWLAGSGISYQWSADRGNGDLDVLFSVDMTEFVKRNPEYQGIPERDIASYENRQLKAKMWPATAQTHFGSQVYEATFYWAPGVHGDIRRLHPYAAYDLKTDAWVVRPPSLPHDPRALYPGEWFDAANQDLRTAESLTRRHTSLTQKLASIPPGSSWAVNTAAELARNRQAAKALFDDIHTGRSAAFGEQGHGYGDYANFRWQHFKNSGMLGVIRQIVKNSKESQSMQDTQLYGGTISNVSAEDILINRAGHRHGS